MTSSTKLTLRNAIPPADATVTFQITEGKKKPIKLTVPSGGSVQHPTNPADGSWLVAAIVASNAKQGASNTTASQTITNPNATISCSIDQIVGRLDVNDTSAPIPGTLTSILAQPATWGDSSAGDTPELHASRSLLLIMQHQEQTQWCWAAVSVSVAIFYHTTTFKQCDMANWAFAQTTCCVDGSTAQCNKPSTLLAALTHVGHMNRHHRRALNLPETIAEINGDHPVGVGIAWTGGGGHFVAIDGYSTATGTAPATIAVADPWYGSSIVVFSTFAANYQGGGNWAETYTTH